MATVTPAQISYTPEGKALQTVKFHAVLSESHQASSQVTKFPVQTGFEISNNVIRKNRVVTIAGIISNYLLEGSNNAFSYSDTDNNKAIFDVLESLVNSGQPCEVMTNLGIYDPVVFTKFTTKQAKGSVDIMEFTITGEEVQVSDAVTGTAPKVLSFSRLGGAAKENRLTELEAVGLEICECNEVGETTVTLGQDFIIEDVNNAGVPVQTTYLSTNQDPVVGDWGYEVHTSDTLIYPPNDSEEQTIFDAGQIKEKARSGFSHVSECLEANAAAVATQAAEDTIDTAMGELKKSLYGAVYSTVNLTDNEYGQTLIQAGIGCVVRGITKEEATFPYSPGEALPTTDEIITGAVEFGKELFSPESEKTTNGFTGFLSTITKIDCCN